MRRTAVIGVLITIVFLVLAFYRIDYQELLAALAGANYWLVLPSALCTFLGYLLRTVRWRAILDESAHCRLTDLFGILMAGFAVNNLVPARLGELARAHLLRRRTGVRKTFVMASVFMERVFDGLVLAGLLTGLSLMVNLPGWGREIQLFAGVLFLAVTFGVAFLLAQTAIVERIVMFVISPLPGKVSTWTSGAFDAFLLGLGTMRRPSVLLQAAGLSLVVWLLEWSSYYVLSAGFYFGLTIGERAAACALLLAVVNLGIMLPASPGYVGTFQFFAVSALMVFGVDRETALAFAIVSHLTQYVLVTAIGLLFFAREHVSLRAITTEAEAEAVGSGAIP